ncbi:MAG: hypothetical protein AB7N76_14505 [Planctomycetota bacterium]
MTTLPLARAAALLLALSAAAAAQDSRPAEPAPKPELETKLVGTLESPAEVPVVFSTDGKALLYVKREEGQPDPKTGQNGERSFIYVKAAADGSGATELFTTPVSWDDILVVFVTPGAISPDGKRVVAITSVEGKKYSEGYVTPLVLDADGTKTPVPSALGGSMGFGLAGERLLVLEAKPNWKRDGGEGYSLEAWKGGKAETIHADPKARAFGLVISPDGKKAAFLVLHPVERRQAMVRVVDLGTRKAVDSDGFRTDDFTFDGPPVILWDAESKGVYLHASVDPKVKRPFALFRMDAGTGKRERVIDADDLAVTAVLGDGLLGVCLRGDEFNGAAVLRLADKRLFRLEARSFIMGGHGRRLALLRRVDGKKVHELVDFTLPK